MSCKSGASSRPWAGKALAAALLGLAVVAGACSSSPSGAGSKFLVVTTVSPITDIAKNVAGTAAEVQGIIPEGVDSHTFEPTPESAKLLSQADLILLNGLHLEDPTLSLARANKQDSTPIFVLGEHAISPSQYIYDFSFPQSGGKPNPHLWMDVAYGIKYAGLIRDELSRVDPKHAAQYRANAASYLRTLHALDGAVQTAVDTVPAQNRALLTYHDSFAYFAHHYGMHVIGAIQPSDFAEPSGKEVAAIIDQIRRERVPAIFGSEVFPSPVLAQIASETGAKYEATLRDDDLPGDPGGAEHSYVGLILYDVRTMVSDLGGDPSALDQVKFTNRYD
jgi:ABC-type Zn uptake system ZnuABC Zn-binding protein ZnuA